MLIGGSVQRTTPSKYGTGAEVKEFNIGDRIYFEQGDGHDQWDITATEGGALLLAVFSERWLGSEGSPTMIDLASERPLVIDLEAGIDLAKRAT